MWGKARNAPTRCVIEFGNSRRSMMSDSDKYSLGSVIFLHIPKCAGSTLGEIISRQYPSSHTHHITTIPDLQKSINEFQNLPKSAREDIRFLWGHGVFGLHNYLSGRTEYVTLLREPVDRVISYYYYVRRTQAHRHHEAAQEMSLREYVTSGVNKMLDNQMTRAIVKGVGEANVETFRQAKENLNKYFAVVGLVEHFDKSILLMKQYFGWGDVSYRKRNVSPNHPSKKDLRASLREQIEERNHWDRKLYKYGAQQLKRKVNKSNLELGLRTLQFRCWLRSLKAETKSIAQQAATGFGLR